MKLNEEIPVPMIMLVILGFIMLFMVTITFLNQCNNSYCFSGSYYNNFRQIHPYNNCSCFSRSYYNNYGQINPYNRYNNFNDYSSGMTSVSHMNRPGNVYHSLRSSSFKMH